MNENDSTTEGQPDPIATSEPASVEIAPITRIGVETELSKYPIHHLAKRGEITIDIQKVGPNGTVELRWEVNYNAKFGPPGPLAYKLDTLVINRQIDREARPLPRVIKLGSMREVAAMLDLGNDTPKLRRALRQNVGAIISAKLKYKTADGGEKTLEADFSRYTAIFTGEHLPNGQKADALYLILNDVYREVINNAPVRPLNYEYLKSLPPSSQRFYEVISARIYAALKHSNPFARILYSEFCRYSALTRHLDHKNFYVQMAAIHQPHLKSGYIAKVHYEEQRDEQGSVVDWMMCYKPGPRARAEYMAFARKSKRAAEAATLPASQAEVEITDYEVGESSVLFTTPTPTPKREKPESKHPLHDELIKRGISETKTQKLLGALKPGQEVLDQLEYVDYLIASEPRKFTSPPGFYVYFLTDNVLVPPSFETSRKRKNREAMQAAAQEETLRNLELETAYEQYQATELDRFIEAQVSQAEIDEITKRKRASIHAVFKNFALMPASTQQTMLWGAVKAEIRPRVRLQSFQEFREAQNTAQMSLFSASTNFPVEPPPTSPTPVPAKASELPQGDPKASRKGKGSHPAKTYALEAKFEATEDVPKAPGASPSGASPAPPDESRSESATQQAPAPDDRLLLERYNAFKAKEARRALDQLGMLERRRRLKDLRSKLLADHPRAEEFRQMMADEEYEKFHKIVENHLMEQTVAQLALPAFEDWKRYALSAMGM